jgi:hypothetical protein
MSELDTPDAPQAKEIKLCSVNDCLLPVATHDMCVYHRVYTQTTLTPQEPPDYRVK